EQRGRGLGGALYEALRQDLMARGAGGLFLEVPTDDPAQVPNPAHLKANKNRLKFYERYDARPIVGTLYDQPIRPGKPPDPRPHPPTVFLSPRRSLHHARERGYVERPARVDVILKSLDELPDVERLKVRNFGEGPIRAVHDTDFVNFVRDYCLELPEGELVYPYVFPIRRTDRPPHDRGMRV